MLKREAEILGEKVYIGIPSPDELCQIILSEDYPMDRQSIINDLRVSFNEFTYVMVTIWYSDPEYTKPYRVSMSRMLDIGTSDFHEWAEFDLDYNLTNDPSLKLLIELYK